MKTLFETLKRKWAEYLLEIIVITIGILGAYTLNNWNESKKERQLELKYLASMKADLQEDLLRLEFMSKFRGKTVSSAKELLIFHNEKSDYDPSEFFGHMLNVFYWDEFMPNRNTQEELVSSGHLSLIKNDSVKNQLLVLNGLNDRMVSVRMHMRREFEHYLYDRSVIHYDLNDYMDIENMTIATLFAVDSISTSLNRVRLVKESSEFLSDRIVRNGLLLASTNNIYMISMYNEAYDQTKKLIAIIDQELLKGS